MIEKYLMSFDEYNKVEHPIPYSFKVESGNQYLYYFGANHSSDPKDEQYEMIRSFWKEFLEKTVGKNCLVLVEGGVREVQNSEEEAIYRGSEASFVTYLASKKSIDTFSPEPPEKFKFDELAKHFDKEEIVFYHFARMAHQWNKIPKDKRPDFHKYLGHSLSQEQKDSGWYDFDFSIENMARLQKEMLGKEFDMYDEQFFYDVINPLTTFSKVNAVSRFEDEGFRDSHILKEIERFWSEGKNFFIVYGASHAVMHEPAVKKLTENSEVLPEFGIKRENEERRDGGCGIVFDPQTQKYAVGKQTTDGLLRLFSGGVDAGEDIRTGVLREVTEESGLRDFLYVEKIAEALTHYRNNLRNVNRVAKATCFIIILKSSILVEVKLEAHEKFTLAWATAEEILSNWQSRNTNKDYDHWVYFLKKSVARAKELGYDKTSAI